jgi:hypothetical protein
MDALVKNAADEEQVKEAKQAEKLKKKKELSGIYNVMSTQEGRRYIKELIEYCGVFKTSYAVDNRIYYNEGIRNVGLKLIADINESCPELYVMMMEEAKKEM